MRIIDITDGIVTLRWTWLPFWAATHPSVQKELEGEMTAWLKDTDLVGKEPTPEILDRMHAEVCERIETKLKIKGMARYIDAIRHVDPIA